MQIGSQEHKAQFIQEKLKESQEAIWKNELHLMRLNDELALTQKELERLQAIVEENGKKAAKAEDKQVFVLERTIEHTKKEIATVEETLKFNQYHLNDLLPRYEEQARGAR